MNFAAVFAELLPHSELAAAERCGVNLAQDLIDRWSQCFFLSLAWMRALYVTFATTGLCTHRSTFFTQLNATVTGVNPKS